GGGGGHRHRRAECERVHDRCSGGRKFPGGNGHPRGLPPEWLERGDGTAPGRAVRGQRDDDDPGGVHAHLSEARVKRWALVLAAFIVWAANCGARLPAFAQGEIHSRPVSIGAQWAPTHGTAPIAGEPTSPHDGGNSWATFPNGAEMYDYSYA